jgi:hypothetical protein
LSLPGRENAILEWEERLAAFEREEAVRRTTTG